MAKSKKQNKSLSLLKTLKLLLKSVNILYIILILAVVQISNLLLKNDNITLFLFIMISAMIYTIEQNMIIVLGIPLVIISILLLLKHFFSSKMNEGFDSMENFDEIDFLKWSSDYFNNDNKYLEYTQEISDKGSLKDVVSNLLKNNNDETSKLYLDFMLYINSLDKSNEDYDKEPVIYVRGIINMYISEKVDVSQKENNKNKEKDEMNIEETVNEDEMKIEETVIEDAKETEDVNTVEINKLTEEAEMNENIENFIGKYTLF